MARDTLALILSRVNQYTWLQSWAAFTFPLEKEIHLVVMDCGASDATVGGSDYSLLLWS